MRFNNVSILSIAHIDAPHVIESSSIMDQLAPLVGPVGLKSDMFEAITGIRTRRFWDESVQPSQVAAQAAGKAIQMADIDPKKIGVLLNTSVCRDYIEPSTASIIHGKLELPCSCLNMDIGNACLGFINGMDIASTLIERQDIDYAIIVDGESSRFAVENTIKRLLGADGTIDMFRDQFATLTLGSGAAAMVLGHSSAAPDGHRYLGGVSVAATEHHTLCRGQVDCMSTDFKQLLSSGLNLAEKTWNKGCDELGWDPDTHGLYVLHQVSQVHTAKFCERLKLNMDKAYLTFSEFGNIGPAAVPITLSKSIEAGRVKKGDRIGLFGIGSGLNCTMAETIW